MIKKTKAERLAQQQADVKLATVYRGVKAQDGALKIYEGRMTAMPERKLTFQSKQFQLSNKHFNTFSKA